MKRIFVTLSALLALLTLPLAEATPPPAALEPGVMPPELLEAAAAARDLPLPERMKRISDPLLGRAYRADAEGEGRGPDLDPPARYDAFDCLTFAEEAP